MLRLPRSTTAAASANLQARNRLSVRSVFILAEPERHREVAQGLATP